MKTIISSIMLSFALLSTSLSYADEKVNCTCTKECAAECKNGHSKNCKCKHCNCKETGKCDSKYCLR
jgi:hypothetical protein